MNPKRILFVDTYYPNFLKSFYKKNKNWKKRSYKNLKDTLINSCFGTSDFYSYYISKYGYKAQDLIINDPILQQKWADEKKIETNPFGLWQKIKSIPIINRVTGKQDWVQKILISQIRAYEPDIVYIQDLSVLDIETLKECKKNCRLLLGQIACPLPERNKLKCFDLILSSFPHYVEIFRTMGINSEYFKLGFDQRIARRLNSMKRIYPVTFIGSFGSRHIAGTQGLEKLASKVPVHVWGQGIEHLSPSSPLRKNYHGEVWGVDMYKILAKSKIVVNRHIEVSDKYANNMRLFESTGMGALLITDKKKNTKDIFRPGKDIVEYKDPDELIKLVNYYLDHDTKRLKVARAGRIRTMKFHNYGIRMKELDKILTHYLK